MRGDCAGSEGLLMVPARRKGGWGGKGGMQKAESGKLEELGRCACELRSLRRAALVPSRYYCTSCLSISLRLIGLRFAYLTHGTTRKLYPATFLEIPSSLSCYNHELVMIYKKQT